MLDLFRNEVDWPQDVRLLSEAARIASAVVRIPRQFYELQTVSEYTLLKKTGYFNESPAIFKGSLSGHIRSGFNRSKKLDHRTQAVSERCKYIQ